MAEALRQAEAEQAALDARIDDILAAHDGSWRAAMETLLMVADARAETISYGYVRGHPPGTGAWQARE